MPYNFDFSNLKKTTIEISVDGWISPLEIEYAITQIDQLPLSCYWRVKNTNHTFVIPSARLDFISKGNYNEHFSAALSAFREDYLEWREQGFSSDWMQEYYREYYKFIITGK
jgi:hypothetical protein